MALRFLATGETFRSLEFQFRISRARISEAAIEVSEAIVKALNNYLNTSLKQNGSKFLESSIKDEIFQTESEL